MLLKSRQVPRSLCSGGKGVWDRQVPSLCCARPSWGCQARESRCRAPGGITHPCPLPAQLGQEVVCPGVWRCPRHGSQRELYQGFIGSPAANTICDKRINISSLSSQSGALATKKGITGNRWRKPKPELFLERCVGFLIEFVKLRWKIQLMS